MSVYLCNLHFKSSFTDLRFYLKGRIHVRDMEKMTYPSSGQLRSSRLRKIFNVVLLCLRFLSIEMIEP